MVKNSKLDVFCENNKKLTYIYLANFDGEKVLIKSFSKNSPSLIKENFKREKLIYSLKPYGAPKLIKFDESSITLKYIDGVTLGDLAFNSSLGFQQVNDVFQSALLFYKSLSKKSKNGKSASYTNLWRYLSVLSNSGPIQNKNIEVKKPSWLWTKAQRSSHYFLGVLCKFFSILERCVFNVNYYQGLSHSDFHYNNILVKNSRIYFIDFERMEFKGFFIFDLLFLLVVLEAVEMKKFGSKLNKSLQKKLLGSLGKKLIYLSLKWAVLFNKKFKKNL